MTEKQPKLNRHMRRAQEALNAQQRRDQVRTLEKRLRKLHKAVAIASENMPPGMPKPNGWKEFCDALQVDTFDTTAKQEIVVEESVSEPTT